MARSRQPPKRVRHLGWLHLYGSRLASVRLMLTEVGGTQILVRTMTSSDPDFADDLEQIQADQPRLAGSPRDS